MMSVSTEAHQSEDQGLAIHVCPQFHHKHIFSNELSEKNCTKYFNLTSDLHVRTDVDIIWTHRATEPVKPVPLGPLILM